MSRPDYNNEEIYWYHDEDNLLSNYSLNHTGVGFDFSKNLSAKNKLQKLEKFQMII